LPLALVLKATRKGHRLETKAPLTGMPKTFAQPLSIRRNIENNYLLIAGADKLGKHWSCDAGNPFSRLRCLARWTLNLSEMILGIASEFPSPLLELESI